jgi:hypothetical protein
MQQNHRNAFSSRVNVAFIFRIGGEPKATVTSVIAHASGRGDYDIRFFGGPSFSSETRKHILDVVMPAAKRILSNLNLPKTDFEISIVNFDVSSVHDVELSISGNSGDVSIFLAILSAGLQISVPEDAVFTGCIASVDGDIRMVKGIPAKVKAIIDNKRIQTFFHPMTNIDSSLDHLSPKEKEKIDDALIEAKSSLQIFGIRDLYDLVRKVYSDEQVVLASLIHGFYGIRIPILTKENVILKVVRFFTQFNEKRFWSVLENQLITGRGMDAGELLKTFIRFYIKRKKYPKDFGMGLIQLVHSLPPDVRHRKLAFPLIPVSECIRLSQFADEHQNEDVLLMFKSISGEKNYITSEIEPGKQRNNFAKESQSNTLLKMVLLEINKDTLAKRIGLPIDSARATYIIDSVIIESYEEFFNLISSFYIHILRHTRKAVNPIDTDMAGAEGFALLERAFSNKGGFQAAVAEARNATNGGLRFVLDLMTEQFKKEQHQKHIIHVFKLALDPLDWQGKVNLMKSLLDRLKSHLPIEITSQPAERYAGHYEDIVEAYVQSMDQVKSIFRSI